MAKQSLSSGPLGGYPENSELERFLDLERLHRMNECLVASTSKMGPVVHGVENFHGGRFWALANNSDSDSDVEQTSVLPKTRQLQQLAPLVSSVVPHYFPAGSVLSPVLSTASGHRSVRSFSSPMLESAQKRKDRRPWKGRIPAPRVSLCLTLGDAISRAKIIQKKANSWPRSGITMMHSSLDQRQPSTVIRKEFQNSSNGRILRRNARCVDGPVSSVSRTMKLGPRMPYRPTAGLVSLFARTGTNIGVSRAPIAREHSENKSSVAPLSFAASYAQVVARSMEGESPRSGWAGRRWSLFWPRAVRGALWVQEAARFFQWPSWRLRSGWERPIQFQSGWFFCWFAWSLFWNWNFIASGGQ
jgi:hypothetical protein